jgi:hypothetical protein
MSTLLGIEGADVMTAELPNQIDLGEKTARVKELRRLDQVRAGMAKDRQQYEERWEAVADYVKPDMYYRSGKTPNDGYKQRTKIVNPTPSFALNIFQAGMFSGTANPTRSWFRIGHENPELNNVHEVKEWLTEVHDRMQNVMIKSNLYKALPRLFSQLGLFGIGAIVVVDDADDIIRFHNRMVGQFYIANDERGNVGTYLEEQPMTVEQVIRTFGYRQASDRVQRLYNDNSLNSEVKVCWLVERNKEYDPDKLESRFKKYRTTYWEKGNVESGLLSVSGVDAFPVISPRAEQNGNDPYGIGAGVEALPDMKALALAEKQLQLAREMNVKPSLIVPSSLGGHAAKLFIPGSYIFSDSPDQIKSAHNVRVDEQGTRIAIQALEERIKEFFHVPLFLMIANDGRSNITATEIQARQQERMMALGPVLQNLNDEAFDRLIDLVYDAMDRRGLIPEPPEQLQGSSLTVEYISVLAQAQKAADVTSLDRYVGSVFNLAGGDPMHPVLDNIPYDEVAHRYHALLGQHPDVIKTQEIVDEERDQRAQQAQQAQELEQAASLAQTAQTLSATPTDGASALTQILGGGQL